jgi:tetratricopeptide (TPR) repeat protein
MSADGENQRRDLRKRADALANANDLRLNRDYHGAIAGYMDVVDRFGETADLLAVIASCYITMAARNPGETGQNFSKAVALMEKAVSLAPEEACWVRQLAEYYWLGLTDYEKAAEMYRRAIDLNRLDSGALVGAAALYGVPEGVVGLDEAVTWLEAAVALSPRDAAIRYRLGCLYREAGRATDAWREWIAALMCPEPLSRDATTDIRAAVEATGDDGDGT